MLWGVASTLTMVGIHMVPKALCLQKYCQIFSQNVSCFCSLLCTTSTLVLSHANTRRLSSSTLKLLPYFVFLGMTIWTLGGELETYIGLFWDISTEFESTSISPWMKLV